MVPHLEEAASVIQFALKRVTVAMMLGWCVHVSMMKCMYSDGEYYFRIYYFCSSS